VILVLLEQGIPVTMCPLMARSLSQWWTGTMAFGYMKARELCGQPVLCKQEEAEDRALTCSTCFHNKVPDNPTWAEKWAGGEMRKMTGDRRTMADANIGVCRVCSCELRSLVHFEKDIVLGFTNDLSKYPAHCWKRKAA
jgi:hypothetical protein